MAKAAKKKTAKRSRKVGKTPARKKTAKRAAKKKVTRRGIAPV